MLRERKVVVGPTPTPAQVGGGWWGQPATAASSTTVGGAPWGLVAVFGIVVFYLYLSTYLPFKEDLHRGFSTLKVLFFILLPTLLYFLIRSNYTTQVDVNIAGNSSVTPRARSWYDIRYRRAPPDPVLGGGADLVTTS